MPENDYNWGNVRKDTSNLTDLTDDELRNALSYVCRDHRDGMQKERQFSIELFLREREMRLTESAISVAKRANTISIRSIILSILAILITVLNILIKQFFN